MGTCVLYLAWKSIDDKICVNFSLDVLHTLKICYENKEPVNL